MATKESGIYQIRCLVNGKVYIGSAKDIEDRWRVHRGYLNRGRHHSRHLQAAWWKYGAGQFIFEILEIVEDESRLMPVEQEYLDRVKPWDDRVGYNISPTAATPRGCKRSEESRAKMSDAQRKRYRSPEEIERISRLGQHVTDEDKRTIGEKTRLRWADPEYRARVVASQKKRLENPEVRKKNLGNLAKARDSEERIAKISAALTGKTLSEAHRAKIAETSKRRAADPEWQSKMQAARKRAAEHRRQMLHSGHQSEIE